MLWCFWSGEFRVRFMISIVDFSRYSLEFGDAIGIL